MTWADRTTGYGKEAPDQLLANPLNWRLHPKAQQEAMAGVLSDIGWISDVIVNERTGHVIDGHLRIELAISNGESEVPVRYVDLSEDEERVALATYDPIGAMVAEDREIQAQLLDGLTAQDERTNAFLDSLREQIPDSVPQTKASPEPTMHTCPSCGFEFA